MTTFDAAWYTQDRRCHHPNIPLHFHYLIDHQESNDHHGDWYYPTLGYVLFALVESFGSVSITIFWAFANSHLTLETAERHYGSIVALAQMGAIAGSTLSALSGRRRQQQEQDDE